tara:strand:- start:3691 stop:4047 length:357 start_codon:yes stop_codon:yes gene_type:complete
MKATITDPGTLILLEDQLKRGGLSWLYLTPFRDVAVQNHQFAVYSAAIFAEETVLDSWVITVMGNSGVYNQSNYPDFKDAVSQHIGRLAVEGKLIVVDIVDANADIPENEPPHDLQDL